MPASVAQIISDKGTVFHGKSLKASGGSLKQGMLARLTSGSEAAIALTSNVDGIVFGQRYATYRPANQVFAVGEPLTLAWGVGEILLSVDYFLEGNFPAPLADVYVGAGGLWAASGTVKVGQCIQLVERSEPVGGVGAAQSLMLVRYNIQP